MSGLGGKYVRQENASMPDSIQALHIATSPCTYDPTYQKLINKRGQRCTYNFIHARSYLSTLLCHRFNIEAQSTKPT